MRTAEFHAMSVPDRPREYQESLLTAPVHGPAMVSGGSPLLCDRLHGLTAVASGHRMTGLPTQTVAVPTRTRREPAAYRRNSRFLSRSRAVARSRRSFENRRFSRSRETASFGRPHRNPCHCRVTNRPRSSPPLVCWGPASHRFRSKLRSVGPRQKRSVGHPVRPQSGGFPHQSVRSTPACSLLGSDSVGALVTHGKAGVCACISVSEFPGQFLQPSDTGVE
jgi:hypothetical protein